MKKAKLNLSFNIERRSALLGGWENQQFGAQVCAPIVRVNYVL